MGGLLNDLRPAIQYGTHLPDDEPRAMSRRSCPRVLKV
jgi:hypothetical protein